MGFSILDAMPSHL